jgi:hypothetical protein
VELYHAADDGVVLLQLLNVVKNWLGSLGGRVHLGEDCVGESKCAGRGGATLGGESLWDLLDDDFNARHFASARSNGGGELRSE